MGNEERTGKKKSESSTEPSGLTTGTERPGSSLCIAVGSNLQLATDSYPEKERRICIQDWISMDPYWPLKESFTESFNLPKPNSHSHAEDIYIRMENCPENE